MGNFQASIEQCLEMNQHTYFEKYQETQVLTPQQFNEYCNASYRAAQQADKQRKRVLEKRDLYNDQENNDAEVNQSTFVQPTWDNVNPAFLDNNAMQNQQQFLGGNCMETNNNQAMMQMDYSQFTPQTI